MELNLLNELSNRRPSNVQEVEHKDGADHHHNQESLANPNIKFIENVAGLDENYLTNKVGVSAKRNMNMYDSYDLDDGPA